MSTYSFSGLEYRILSLTNRQEVYSLTMDGPWWMRLLYDLGILQVYVNRLVNQGYIREVRTGWQYELTASGFVALIRDRADKLA